MNANNIIYFDSFRVEHISKEIERFIGNENTVTNIYRIQEYNSIMCAYFCIGFIYFMLKVKVFLMMQIYFLLMIMKRTIK